jgi:phosphate transport system substrate-binding protein
MKLIQPKDFSRLLRYVLSPAMEENRPGTAATFFIILGLSILGIVGMGTFLIQKQLRFSDSRPISGNSIQPEVVGTGSAQFQGGAQQAYRSYSDVPNVPTGIFNYGGSTTFAPLRSPRFVQAFQAAFPQFQLRYTEPPLGKPGSGQGIQMLFQGQLSFAQSSRGLKAEEIAEAKKRGLVLEEIPIAIDGIAIYVNPQVVNGSLPGLSADKVGDIFTGKVQNWKDVGGPNLDIFPIRRRAGDYFSEKIMLNRPFGATVKEVRDTTKAIRLVTTTPGAISYATASVVINQKGIRPIGIAKGESHNFISPCVDMACTAVNTKAFWDASYPITRHLFIVIKRGDKLDEQAGVAYANLLLSDEGQKSVSQAGFVPIR